MRQSGGRWIARAAASPLVWVLAIAFMFSWPIVRSIRAAADLPDRRPVIGTVPDFTLIDQNGEPVDAASLRGRVWIASFTASDCTHICPAMLDQMSKVQHRVRGLGQSIKLVTFTNDPRRDTPERFAALADKHRVSPRIWAFATGDPSQVEIALGAFGVAAAPQTRFFLVDREMKIRGYYDLSDREAQDLLVRDAGLLVNRGD